MENIDDDCEERDINFVKVSDDNIDKEYDLASLPALAFYRNKLRTVYVGKKGGFSVSISSKILNIETFIGDLMKEEEILEWVNELYDSNADVIESVDRKTLQVLINDVEHLAVFFCKYFESFLKL